MTPVEYCELILRNCEHRSNASPPPEVKSESYLVLAESLARKLGKSPREVIMDSLNLYQDYLRFNSRR